MLTEKCKQDFEKYAVDRLKKLANMPDEVLLNGFYSTEFTFQIAYAIDFFDSVNIDIHTDITESYYIGKIYISSLNNADYMEKFYHNITRNEVLKQLIIVANKKYNESKTT